MTTTTAINVPLALYSQAVKDLERYREMHSLIFDTYDAMQKRVDEAKQALTEEVRKSGNCEDAMFTVTVTHPAKRWYDADTVFRMAAWVRDLPGVIVSTVSQEAIAALAKNKTLSPEVIEAAYREQSLTPAVSIKRKGERN